MAVKIWIVSAQAFVSRPGTQKMRQELQDKFRLSHPELSQDVESQPWYCDPYGPAGRDDFAQFEFTWSLEDQHEWSIHNYLPIVDLPSIRQYRLGQVETTCDPDDCVDFSFNLKASYAFDILRALGHIPVDSLLMNDVDEPLDYNARSDDD